MKASTLVTSSLLLKKRAQNPKPLNPKPLNPKKLELFWGLVRERSPGGEVSEDGSEARGDLWVAWVS